MGLLEAMIAVLIMALVLYVVQQIMSSGRRGTLHGQEAADHHLAEVVLARVFEQDVKSMIPCPIRTVRGPVPATVRFDPHRIAATALQFPRFVAGEVIQVQYVFDPARREVRRLELAADGRITRAERFGTGLIARFTIEDCSPAMDASLLWLSMTLQGKLRTTRVDKVFACGFPPPGPGRAWVFDQP
ncbi:MAG: hypothetical protein OZSIB_2002 [Candidatus Ozemobacter sibiricus]|uniref:Uncharacterized protein n=1 Tax=Candidatus Ozemobacter sibiricus TaxID=2268124 RepID=A0A367ZIL4_9BACT|nr:MAG: hypothetical protein OZSIB_2002 [Candidatus Ozemobacter sibiricus]